MAMDEKLTRCPKCDGTGEAANPTSSCPLCKGKGTVKAPRLVCPRCDKELLQEQPAPPASFFEELEKLPTLYIMAPVYVGDAVRLGDIKKLTARFKKWVDCPHRAQNEYGKCQQCDGGRGCPPNTNSRCQMEVPR